MGDVLVQLLSSTQGYAVFPWILRLNRWGLLTDYDIVGEVVMLAEGSQSAFVHRQKTKGSNKELLSELPPENIATSGLVACHCMRGYLSVLQGLGLPESETSE